MDRTTSPYRSEPPVIVCSEKDAFELSERSFTRVADFKFLSGARHRLVSKGPRLQGWSSLLVSSTGHRISLVDDDKVSFLIPYRGIIQVVNGTHTATAEPFQLLVVKPGRRETSLSAGYLGAIVQLPLPAAIQLDNESEPEFDSVLGSLGPGSIKHIVAPGPICRAHLLLQEFEMGSHPLQDVETWSLMLRPLWESIALSIGTQQQASKALASMYQVRRAAEFIEANCLTSITLGAIARACGISGRALQLGFRRHLHCSPMQFLEERRLHRARTMLLSELAPRTVTEIAISCGFNHLGRFAAAYRLAYGETPTETRARSRSGPR